VGHTYAHRALDLFRTYGNAEAIVSGSDRFSYADVRARVLGMAAAMCDHGLRPGAAVLVLVANPPEAVFLQFALHLLGCRTDWMYSHAPAAHRAAFVRDGDVDAVLYDARDLGEVGREVVAAAPGALVFTLGPDAGGVDLAAAPPRDEASLPPPGREPESVFQTSGTTDQLKSVHHRHSFFVAVERLAEHYRETDGRALRHLGQTGHSAVAAHQAVMLTLLTGGTVVMQRGWKLERILHAVEAERITSLFVSPQLMYEMLDDPRTARTDLGSLTMLSVGGSAAAPSRMAEAVTRWGSVVRPVYGSSECPFITAYPDFRRDPEHPERLASCGLPYGDVRIEIRDEAGAVLTAGRDGEIWVRSALAMAGYWRDPVLTEETIVDGWLRTGDVGHLDADGYLYVVDRVTDMVITGRGADKVYCRPVEDALVAHPGVRTAAVVGVPGGDDEAVVAFVVRHRGATVGDDELRALVAAELGDLYAPRHIVFADLLPLTERGKVDKKGLRAAYLARLDPARA
jgi:fatty-acyl-CoA synthase